MSRNGSGVYSLPPQYVATTGETITALQHNLPLTDIAADLNAVRPISSGGTGASTASGARSALGVAIGSDVAAYADRVPPGVVMPYAGSTAPTGWLMCYGQAVSRTTYATLFALVGTTYGVGDGSTTFNIPDLRGRTVAGKDDMGGTSANRLTNQTDGLDGDTLGATGGAETHTLTTAQLAAHAHAKGTLATASDGGAALTVTVRNSNDNGTAAIQGAENAAGTPAALSGVVSSVPDHTHPITGSTANAGSDGAHNNVQPTIILNYIIKAV